MVKKFSCLLTTSERVMMSTQLISRLSTCSTLSPSSQMMSLFRVFLYQMVNGLTDEEVVLTAHLIFNTFSCGGYDKSVTKTSLLQVSHMRDITSMTRLLLVISSTPYELSYSTLLPTSSEIHLHRPCSYHLRHPVRTSVSQHKHDRKYHGTVNGEVGPLVRRL